MRLGQKQKKEDRMSNRTRQNNKTADRKMESNDSPEISASRSETSEVPGLPLGQLNTSQSHEKHIVQVVLGACNCNNHTMFEF